MTSYMVTAGSTYELIGHTHTNTHIHTHILTHTYTHTHTHTQNKVAYAA